MTAYYNEHDKKAAAWLRELIKAGLIANGEVDERSIEDVTPTELMGFTQCHFFAGIGVWSYALRQAGWLDDRPVWTGSCPCQPFSAAGKGGGFDDERHLWPAFHHLISQCRPGVVFGEQVASKDGLAWLDLVQADLEGAGYAVGASDICAAGFGAPHIRQRLYWVGHSLGTGLERHGRRHSIEGGWLGTVRPITSSGQSDWVADTQSRRLQQFQYANASRIFNQATEQAARLQSISGRGSSISTLADTEGVGEQRESGNPAGTRSQGHESIQEYGQLGSTRFLADAEHNGHHRQAKRFKAQSDCDESRKRVFKRDSTACSLADPASDRRREGQSQPGGGASGDGAEGAIRRAAQFGVAGGMANAGNGTRQRSEPRSTERGLPKGNRENASVWPGPVNGFWGDADWIFCRDGKWRSVESGTFPLVDGAPARVERLRGYGNAIVAPVAQAFIEAYLEAIDQ